MTVISRLLAFTLHELMRNMMMMSFVNNCRLLINPSDPIFTWRGFNRFVKSSNVVRFMNVYLRVNRWTQGCGKRTEVSMFTPLWWRLRGTWRHEVFWIATCRRLLLGITMPRWALLGVIAVTIPVTGNWNSGKNLAWGEIE
jgi:hypothetical protein